MLPRPLTHELRGTLKGHLATTIHWVAFFKDGYHENIYNHSLLVRYVPYYRMWDSRKTIIFSLIDWRRSALPVKFLSPFTGRSPMSILIKNPSQQVRAFCAWKMYRDGVGVKNISTKLKIPLKEVQTTLYILGEHPRHSRFRDRDSSREERLRLTSLFN